MSPAPPRELLPACSARHKTQRRTAAEPSGLVGRPASPAPHGESRCRTHSARQEVQRLTWVRHSEGRTTHVAGSSSGAPAGLLGPTQDSTPRWRGVFPDVPATRVTGVAREPLPATLGPTDCTTPPARRASRPRGRSPSRSRGRLRPRRGAGTARSRVGLRPWRSWGCSAPRCAGRTRP
jgi:hypothetical protein